MNDTEINVKGEKRTARFCRRGGAAVVVGASLALAGGVPVFADVTVPADPLAGAMGNAQGSIQTWVTSYGVPVLVGLTLFGILLRLGVKWLKRVGRSV